MIVFEGIPEITVQDSGASIQLEIASDTNKENDVFVKLCSYDEGIVGLTREQHALLDAIHPDMKKLLDVYPASNHDANAKAKRIRVTIEVIE